MKVVCESWIRHRNLMLLAVCVMLLGMTTVACDSGGRTPTDPGGNPLSSISTEEDQSQSTGGTSSIEDEFQGRVASANTISQSLVLVSGLEILTDGGTDWDPRGDVFSVEEISTALARGVTVRVEGRGGSQGLGVIADSIKAETDENDGNDDDDGDDADDDDDSDGDDDDDSDDDGDSDSDSDGDSDGDDDSDGRRSDDHEFEGGVSSVDELAGRLSLNDGSEIIVDEETRWKSGDFQALSEIAGALVRGDRVEAEGKGVLQSDGSILAAEIKAEFDD